MLEEIWKHVLTVIVVQLIQNTLILFKIDLLVRELSRHGIPYHAFSVLEVGD